MCLAIPGKVKSINGREATIEYPGETRRAMVGVENLKVGDFVLVQMGIAIKTISSDEAEVSWQAWKKNGNH